MPDIFIDWIALCCVIGGALSSVAAGIGLLRFRDPLSRLHAATKPQILGLLLLMLAVALDQRSVWVFLALVPIFVLQSLTAPVSAHMAGRAAYRAGHFNPEQLCVDELAPVIKNAAADVIDPDHAEISAEEAAKLTRHDSV